MLRLILTLVFLTGSGAYGDVFQLQPTSITEWKAVYGEVEPRDLVPARARIGGTIVALEVTEGDRVAEGARIAVVVDDKLVFQQEAVDAQLAGLTTQLATAQADLERGESLRERGVITVQRLDQLRTAVDVLENNIKSAQAERLVLEQRVAEGAVLSPVNGVVLSVPVARGSVINPGEPIAQIAGGGVFLRLALPERHADSLTEGDQIELGTQAGGAQGTLVKLFPQIEAGRVLADVEVPDLDARFIGRRLPVRVPVAQRAALMVPVAAVSQLGGLDFVTIETHGDQVRRTVVPGRTVMIDGHAHREILSGLRAGDMVVTPDE